MVPQQAAKAENHYKKKKEGFVATEIFFSERSQ